MYTFVKMLRFVALQDYLLNKEKTKGEEKFIVAPDNKEDRPQ